MENYIIYTDGGCDINPGGKGGYGYVIINTDTGEVTEGSHGFESTTNNRMEVMAAIEALSEIPKGSVVKLHADSQYLLKTIEGEFAKKKNTDLWDRLDSAMDGIEITTVWVRGHNGDQYNERCDELATEARDGELSKDAGYDGGKRVAPKHTVAKPSQRNIPFEDRPSPYGDAPGLPAYGEEPSFKVLAKLRVGGSDIWTRTAPKTLEDRFPEETGLLKAFFGNQRDTAKALRWYCRGLSLRTACRKVLVDAEITENLQKKK